MADHVTADWSHLYYTVGTVKPWNHGGTCRCGSRASYVVLGREAQPHNCAVWLWTRACDKCLESISLLIMMEDLVGA